MRAIDYLKKIGILDAQINNDIDEIAQLEALATKTTSVLGGERVQASVSQDKMADCVVRITALKARLSDEILAMLQYKNVARKVINEACDADCCSLLHKRYFLNRKWEEIAVEMGFTYQWVSGGLHQRALSQVQRLLDEGKDKIMIREESETDE